MLRYIVFDVDGTLINTEEVVVESYQRVFFEEFGKKFTAEEIKMAMSIPTHKAMERLGFTDPQTATKTYQQYLLDAFCRVRPFDGISELLANLKEKGFVIGLVTSRSRSEVKEDTCLQKLMGHFGHVVCCTDTQNPKPSPEPLQLAMKLAGFSAEETIYIGDSLADSLCSRDAGVPFVLALWGARYPDDIQAQYRLKQPGQVMDLVESLNGKR